MIDFGDLPAPVQTGPGDPLFEQLVSIRDRGALVRQPGRYARIVREESFTYQEADTLRAYAARNAFKVRTRADPDQPGRRRVWVAYWPASQERAREIREADRARNRARHLRQKQEREPILKAV